jgi:hypothetical protein
LDELLPKAQRMPPMIIAATHKSKANQPTEFRKA